MLPKWAALTADLEIKILKAGIATRLFYCLLFLRVDFGKLSKDKNQFMLYRYRMTGGLVEVVSKHGEGIVMCLDSQDEVLYVEESELVPHLEATTEKIKNEEKLTAEMAAEGIKEAKLTTKDTFPVDPGININAASARQIADHLPGVGLKTARDIKDLQTTMPGEKFQRLDQLTSIKRVDWDEIFKENLVRVE